jgi:protoporphyrinogen IX oxidase
MIDLAITHYNAFKFVHVLSAVVWVGGACTVQVYALLALRTNDPLRVASFAKDTEFVGTRIFLPSSLILLVSGIFTLHDSDGLWSFSQGWVQFGLVVIALSIVVGAGYLGPESGRIAKATERSGVESAEVQQRIRRIFLVSRIELVFLLAVIFDMVVKPGM